MSKMILLAGYALLIGVGAGCSSPGDYALPPTLPAAYALQDANATATAANRAIEATATQQAAVLATEVRQSVALAEMQTETAIPVGLTATQQSLNLIAATATEGAAYRATSITASQLAEANKTSREDTISNIVWGVIVFCILVVTAFVCWLIVHVGNTYETRLRMQAIQIIRGMNDVPYAYLLPNPRRGRPDIIRLESPHVVEQAADPTDEQIAREAWLRAVRGVAQCASLTGTWGVNTLSTREGGLGCTTEDTVIAARNIAAELGAVRDYGGTRGYDWVEGVRYIDLCADIDAGRLFTLPLRPNGSPKLPAEVDISKAQHSKARQAKQEGVVKSPMGRKAAAT